PEDPADDVHQPPARKPAPEAEELLENFATGLRIQQILGQILKNYSQGGLEAEPKLRIGFECYEMGMRMLGFWLKWVDQHTHTLEDEFQELLHAAATEHIGSDEIRSLANGIIVCLTTTLAINMVKKTSCDLAATGL